jgi:cell division protein ZapA (FtsZ GTPase activity inhibitor)
MDAQATTVTIYGQEYTVRGGEDPEYVREVARYVDQRMKEVSKESQQVSSTKVAILAAMNITEELFRERSGAGSALEARAAHLVRALEETFQKDGDGANTTTWEARRLRCQVKSSQGTANHRGRASTSARLVHSSMAHTVCAGILPLAILPQSHLPHP